MLTVSFLFTMPTMSRPIKGQGISLVVFCTRSSKRALSTGFRLSAYIYLAFAALPTSASEINRVHSSNCVVSSLGMRNGGLS